MQATEVRSGVAPRRPIPQRHDPSPPSSLGGGCVPRRPAEQGSAPAPESVRPTQGQAGPGLSRQRWERGRSGFCASLTDWLAQDHSAPGRGSGSSRARRGAGTGHPVLDLLVSRLPWEHSVPAK